MKTKEEILQEHYYEYYKDLFPTEQQVRKYSSLGLVMREELQAIYNAMEEYAQQFVPVSSRNPFTNDVVHYI